MPRRAEDAMGRVLQQVIATTESLHVQREAARLAALQSTANPTSPDLSDADRGLAALLNDANTDVDGPESDLDRDLATAAATGPIVGLIDTHAGALPLLDSAAAASSTGALAGAGTAAMLATPSSDVAAASAMAHSMKSLPRVAEPLAAFVVRSLLLHPDHHFDVNRDFTPEDVARLVGLASGQLAALDDPVIANVRMQVFFDTHYPTLPDHLQRFLDRCREKIAPFLQDVLGSRSRAVATYEALYGKIVSFCLTSSRVGNAMDIRTVREVTAALESVFPQTELTHFVTLTRAEKERQVQGLAQLVTGIRLFNKQLGKGGESVEVLNQICVGQQKQLLDAVTRSTRLAETRLTWMMALLDWQYACQTKHATLGHSHVPAPWPTERYAHLAACAHLYQQYLIYLDTLRIDVEKTSGLLLTLQAHFDDTVEALKASVRSKHAVPVDQVYPHFITLATLWKSWEEGRLVIAFRRDLLERASACVNAVALPALSDPRGIELARSFVTELEPAVPTDAAVIIRQATALGDKLNGVRREMDVLHPGNTPRFDVIRADFGGFCLVTFHHRGVARPGDKGLGFYRYRDRVFLFADAAAVLAFAQDPERYVQGAVNAARRSADLVCLMHMQSYFPSMEALDRASSFERQYHGIYKLAMQAEVGCQVDTHIETASAWDKSYEWNEWNLRRRALQLLNLKTKRTKMNQTLESVSKRNATTQLYLPKTSETQTMQTVEQAMATHRPWYGGLRYAPDTVSRLTRYGLHNAVVPDAEPGITGVSATAAALTPRSTATTRLVVKDLAVHLNDLNPQPLGSPSPMSVSSAAQRPLNGRAPLAPLTPRPARS